MGAAIDIKADSHIQLDSEIMLVTGIVSSTKITVERAQEVHLRHFSMHALSFACVTYNCFALK